MTYLTHSIDCISLMLVNWFYFFHVSRRNGNCNVSNTRAIILVDCRNNLFNHFYSVARIILFVYIAFWKLNYKNLTIFMGLIWNSAGITFYIGAFPLLEMILSIYIAVTSNYPFFKGFKRFSRFSHH